jgi:hypothetical protein
LPVNHKAIGIDTVNANQQLLAYLQERILDDELSPNLSCCHFASCHNSMLLRRMFNKNKNLNKLVFEKMEGRHKFRAWPNSQHRSQQVHKPLANIEMFLNTVHIVSVLVGLKMCQCHSA